MKTFLFLALFVLALFGIPMVWFLAEVFIESGIEEFRLLINMALNYKIGGHTVEHYIDEIIYDHEPKVNKLYWDYRTKTMYGHPIMVTA